MTLLVVPATDPFMVGLYDTEGRFIRSLYGSQKVSEGLLPVLYEFLKSYSVRRIVYVNGPGSHMATKIAYVTLRTLSVVLDVPLYGCSVFDLNGGKPVKAIGKLYFVKEKETIITKKLPQPVATDFSLPETIKNVSLEGDALPDYQLPAV